MTTTTKNFLTFLTGFGCVVLYYVLWHIFRFDGWRTSFNIPGFALLALSWPWNVPFYPNQLFQDLGISQETKRLMSVMSVAFGFGFNLLISKTVICYVKKKFKNGVGT